MFSSKKNQQEYKYNLGLVLSGGGTRGFAHLGVLKALEQNNLKPDIISSVSAGSIAGALYADGWAPEEIIEIISSKKIRNYVNLFIPDSGFIRMSGFEKLLNQYLRAKVFEELQVPIKVYAVNINTGEYTCFEKGPIIKAVIASSSIPIIFPPIEIDGNHYVDGGLLNNFPVEPLYGKCRSIIGVNVNPIGEIKKPKSIRKLTERTLQLNIWGHTLERRKLCDLYIEPQGLTAYSMANLSSAKACFKLGYEATLLALQTSFNR